MSDQGIGQGCSIVCSFVVVAHTTQGGDMSVWWRGLRTARVAINILDLAAYTAVFAIGVIILGLLFLSQKITGMRRVRQQDHVEPPSGVMGCPPCP